MNKTKLSGIALALALSFASLPSYAEVMVGGAEMYANRKFERHF